MKFSIDKKDIVHYVQNVTSIVSSKPALQVVSNLLIECFEETNTVKLVASDLNMTVIVDLPASVLISGSICISAKSFSDIVQAMPDALISFQTIDDKLIINCQNSNFNLNYVDSSLYPIIPPINREKEIQFPNEVFKKMIENTTFATSTDVSNQMYSGVYCNFSSSEQVMAATDSKRIAEVKYLDQLNIEESQEFVISVKSLNFLEKFLDGSENIINIIVEEKKVIFIYNNVIVICNKYEGKYPIYSVVFKKEHDHQLMIDRQLIKDAIRRVSLLSSDNDKNIMKFDIKQSEILLEAINSELGNAKELITEFSYNGEDITFGLNSKFVQSFLNVIDSDEVIFKIGKSTEPIWVLNNSDKTDLLIRFVVMPLRLE